MSEEFSESETSQAFIPPLPRFGTPTIHEDVFCDKKQAAATLDTYRTYHKEGKDRKKENDKAAEPLDFIQCMTDVAKTVAADAMEREVGDLTSDDVIAYLEKFTQPKLEAGMDMGELLCGITFKPGRTADSDEAYKIVGETVAQLHKSGWYDMVIGNADHLAKAQLLKLLLATLNKKIKITQKKR
jgi:hypothetical protein